MTRSLVLAALLTACASDPAKPPVDEPPTRPDGVALCYSAAATNHPATVEFWTAFSAGDRSAREAAIAALAAATEQLPDEEQLHLLAGLAHLWKLAEPLPGEDDLATQASSGLASRRFLERAYELCPTDHRIAAWLGPVLVRFGRAVEDPALVAEGLAILDAGIAAYPSFVLFSKLLVYADEPRESSEYQNALAAVVENSDACAATPLDPACTNHAHANHNVEGAMVFLGDVLAKAGRKDEALAAYEQGITSADFAAWPYQTELSGRVTNIDARIAAHATPDPADDPPVAWAQTNQCAMCHTGP